MSHWQELLAEMMIEHRDPDSAAYNRCDTEPCEWCINAAKVLAVAHDPVGIISTVSVPPHGVIVEGHTYTQDARHELQVMWMQEPPPQNGTLLYAHPPAQSGRPDAFTLPMPVAWASPNTIPLRPGKDNHPCVLTSTMCAANTVPLWAHPPAQAAQGGCHSQNAESDALPRGRV